MKLLISFLHDKEGNSYFLTRKVVLWCFFRSEMMKKSTIQIFKLKSNEMGASIFPQNLEKNSMQYKKTLFLKKKKNSFCKGERIRRKCLEINFIKKNLEKNVIMFVFLMRKKNLSLISEAYLPFKFLKVFAFMKKCVILSSQ